MTTNNPQNRPTDNKNTAAAGTDAKKGDQGNNRMGEDRKDAQNMNAGKGQNDTQGQGQNSTQPGRKGDTATGQDAGNKLRTGPGGAGEKDQSNLETEDGTNPVGGQQAGKGQGDQKNAPERKGENRTDSTGNRSDQKNH